MPWFEIGDNKRPEVFFGSSSYYGKRPKYVEVRRRADDTLSLGLYTEHYSHSGAPPSFQMRLAESDWRSLRDAIDKALALDPVNLKMLIRERRAKSGGPPALHAEPIELPGRFREMPENMEVGIRYECQKCGALTQGRGEPWLRYPSKHRIQGTNYTCPGGKLPANTVKLVYRRTPAKRLKFYSRAHYDQARQLKLQLESQDETSKSAEMRSDERS